MKREGPLLAAACAALFFLLGAPLTRLCGLGHDEGLHAEPAIALAFPDAQRQMTFDLPWMIDSYNGALKAYVLAAAFRLAGCSVAVLRLTTLSFGALAVFFLTLLAFRLYGRGAGACAGLFFATDPALLLGACYDAGPAVISLALKAAGLCLVERGALFSGGVCFGLAFWDKAHFAWFLLAGAILYWKGPRRSPLRAAAGVLAGCLPLFIYNVIHPAATLTASDQFADLWAHAGNLPAVAASRWDSLLSCFSGNGQWMAGGDAPAYLKEAVLVIFSAGACLLAFRPSRQAWFWAALSLGIFLLAVLSPLPVKWHHLYVAYPFPYLVLLASPLKSRRWALLPVALIMLHLAAYREFRADAETIGGRPRFYRGIAPLARWLEGAPRPDTILVDGDLRQRLYVSTQGRIPFAGVDSDFAKPSMLRWQMKTASRIFALREGLLITETSARAKIGGDDPLRLYHLLGFALTPLQRFDWPDGTAWVEAYRFKNPVLEDFEQGRLREGLALWRGVKRRLDGLAEALRKQGAPQEPAPGLIDILLQGPLAGRPAFFTRLTALGLDVAAECRPAGRSEDALFYNDRGVCAVRAGAVGQGARDLQRAVALDPGLLEAYLSLATVYETQGRTALALATLEKAPLGTGKGSSEVRSLILAKKSELTSCARRSP